MDQEILDDGKDEFGNIWITSRTRMQAHARYERYDLISHVALTAYSVLLLAFSVFSDHLTLTKLGPFISEISIVLSLTVLCASLVTWGLKFGKTADQHKECYLALQRLYESFDENKDKGRYSEILDKYPNHTEFDYESMLCRSVFVQGKKIRDRQGEVRVGFLRWLRFVVIGLIRLFVGTVLLTLPLILLGILYVTS